MTLNKARKEYIYPSIDDLQQAFRKYIQQSVKIDNIVVSGNGEPTLYPEFEAAMQAICELRDTHLPGIKIVALSNGAHLDIKKVISGLNLIDEPVIKIDAGNDRILQSLNQPLVRTTLEKLLSHLPKLSSFVSQSLFVKGEIDNSQAETIDEWIEIMGILKPKTIQICTLSRSSKVHPGLLRLEEDELYGIAFKLKKRTTLEAQVFS